MSTNLNTRKSSGAEHPKASSRKSKDISDSVTGEFCTLYNLYNRIGTFQTTKQKFLL